MTLELEHSIMLPMVQRQDISGLAVKAFHSSLYLGRSENSGLVMRTIYGVPHSVLMSSNQGVL